VAFTQLSSSITLVHLHNKVTELNIVLQLLSASIHRAVKRIFN